MSNKIAVIGAGPAGITAAYELAKMGKAVEVFEASSSVGGLARSIRLWGQTVDIGPHRFFSTDTRVNKLWLEVVGRDYRMVDRLTRIFYDGKYFHYPIAPVNALVKLGPLAAYQCISSYLLVKINPPARSDENFEAWVISRFGRRLYEIFFKSYSEKLWGIECKDLDADFAAQRIKKLSLWEVLKNAFGAGRTRHKSLVDQFAYPINGTGMVYERMAKAIRDLGGKIHLDCPVRQILQDKPGEVTGIRTEDGTDRLFDHTISSMPLTLLVKTMEGVPAVVRDAAQSLRFRNTICVYALIKGCGLFRDNWLYIHSPNIRCGRITNFRNWAPQLYGEHEDTVLVLEYWCNSDDPLWDSSNAFLSEIAVRDLGTTGLLKGAEVADTHILRIPRCYPVYRCGYREHVSTIARYLSPMRRLQVIGRYGAFKYNNQDHSILMGMLAAENAANGNNHDLWSINTDYTNYQEHSLIRETGLEKI